jgi:hypothetical protein
MGIPQRAFCECRAAPFFTFLTSPTPWRQSRRFTNPRFPACPPKRIRTKAQNEVQKGPGAALRAAKARLEQER